MANTLSGLIPDLYEALDVVSRELVGLVPSVSLDTSAAQAAIGQTVYSHVAPPATSGDTTPGAIPPDDGDQTIGRVPVTITKSKYSPIRWTGEEQKGVNHGSSYRRIRIDQLSQSFRTLANLMEADLASLYYRASRAYGTPGTTPFATDLSDLAQTRKILVDNGAPLGDLRMTMDTTAGAKLRSLAQLTKVNEAGTTDIQRRGVLVNLEGFDLRESAAIGAVAAGTGAGYLVNNGAGYPKGATAITVDTGTGTLLAGDVITFAGDTNKYVVGTALSGGIVTINAPGLRQAVADNVAITRSAAFTPNLSYSRSAIVLATRAPAIPEEGDMADDRTYMTDPVSGLTFEITMYKQYKRVKYEAAIAWGYAAIKPEHIALLLG